MPPMESVQNAPRKVAVRFGEAKKLLRDIRTILGPQDLRRAVSLLVLMTLVALIESLGTTGMFPVIYLVTNSEQVVNTPWIQDLLRNFGPVDTNALILIGVLLLVGLSILGEVFAAFALYRQQKFAQHLYASLGERVLKGYLSQDYPFFLSRNSAVLLKNVNSETMSFSAGVVLYALYALSNVFLVGFLGVVLIIVNPILNGLVILGAGGLLGLLYFLMRKRITAWGKKREYHLAEMNRSAHQSLTGVKEVKALGCEDAYLDTFGFHARQFAVLNTRYQIATSLIGRLVNVVAVGMIGLVIVYALSTQTPLVDLLIALAPHAVVLYATVYKILPASSAALANWMTVTYYLQSIPIVKESLASLPKEVRVGETTSPEPSKSLALPPFRESITFDNISYHYPESQEDSLQGISLSIPFGERVAFVGASGAGKTTTVDLLLCLLEPSEGTIRMDGEPLTRHNQHAWRKQVGYVPQQIFLADTTLQGNVSLGVPAKSIDRDRLQRAIKMAGLEPVLAKLPLGLDTPLGEHGTRLSGGERQRVGIARALYRQPRLLILDEATSALDTVIEHEILQDVLSLTYDTTIIIISHRLNAVRSCDKLFLLQEGRLIAEGSYNELLQDSSEFVELATERTYAAPVPEETQA